MTGASLAIADRNAVTLASGAGTHHEITDVAAPLPAQLGEWRIEAHIGSGSWSDVFLARGMLGGSRRRLALKVVRAEVSARAGGAVIREAYALSTFRHPNLIHALASWRMAEDSELPGAEVFLLPLAKMSLADHLGDRAASGNGPGDTPSICSAAAGIADALAYLHSFRGADGRGPVIHNDIKPANILRVGRRWLLSDLGLASLPGRAGLPGGAGSLSYLAPEYLDGTPAGKQPPGDVWALGVVLHRWLTGEFPYPCDTPARRASAVRAGTKPALNVADVAVGTLVGAMLAQRPQDRPSASEVARHLRDVRTVRSGQTR